MSYIKYKELAYCNFTKKISVKELPAFVFDYVEKDEIIWCSYSSFRKKLLLTDRKIIISLSHDAKNIYINYKDNGDGISKKDIKHIFDRFYKGENSSHDSIGIGLSLAKTIIEKSNGNISVTSDKNGTEFIIKYFK